MDRFAVRRLAEICLAVALVGSASVAHGATYTWIVPTGDWATPTNWSPNGVPGSGDNVTIANGGIVALSSSQSANNLTLAGGSTINGAGDLAVEGLMTWDLGTLAGAGAVSFNGGLAVDAGGGHTLNRNATLAGTGTFSGNSPSLAISTGRTLTNNSTIEFTGIGGAIESPGALVNNGTIRKTAASTGTTVISAALTNNAAIEVEAGTFSLITSTHTTSATGTWEISSGATLSFSTAHTFQVGSSITGAGNVTFGGGTHSLQGSWTLTGHTTVNTTLNVEANTTFTTITLNGTLGGAGNVTASGLMTWTTGTWTGAGTTSLQGGFLVSGSASRTLTRNLSLDAGTGTFTASSAQLQVSAGRTLTNNSTIEFTSDAGAGVQNVSGPGAFVNNGLVRKTATATATMAISAPFTNDGDVEVLAGTFQLNTSTHTTAATGTWDIASGATLTFATAHTFQPGSSITGAGDVRFQGGTHSLQGTWTLTGLTTVRTTTNVEATTTFQAVVLENSATFGGGGNVTLDGLLTWTSGTWTGAGTATLNAGFLISGSASRTLTRNLTLNGGTGTFTQNSAALQISSARTLTNNSTIEFANDTAGVQNISGPGTLANNGTLRKATPTTVNTSISAPVTNTGTIESLAQNLAFTSSYTQTAGATRLNGGSISSVQTIGLQGGTLEGTGTLSATVNNTGGTVAPGLSAGQLNETGNYTQASGGSQAVEIGGLAAGTQHDVFAVSGSAALNGTLAISRINGYEPNIGDTFVVMTFASRSGDFSTVTGTSIVPGKAFQKTSNAGNVTLTVIAVPVCGNSVVEAGEQCDDGATEPGDCCSETCQYEPAGGACPDDGSLCTGDVCNAVGVCTHPVASAGTACRSAADDCDMLEQCDGSSPACPTDVMQPDETPCNDGAFCNGADTCLTGACTGHEGDPCAGGAECQQTCNETADNCFDLSGTACDDDGETCTQDQCDGAGSCTHSAGNAGTVCRAAAASCDATEQCDGLAPTCPADANLPDGTACDDGNECNTNDECTGGACGGSGEVVCPLCETCDTEGGCIGAPRTDCKQSLVVGKSRFDLKDPADPARDAIAFRWGAGETTTLADFLDPTTSTDYALCVYAGATETPIFKGIVPAGGTCDGKPCWTASTTKGFRYKEKTGLNDGITQVSLRIGIATKAKASVKGKGIGLSSAPLGFPAPELVTPLRAQIQSDGGSCFEATFSTPSKNEAGAFKAKSD